MGSLISILGQTALQTPADWWVAWGLFVVVFVILFIVIDILIALWVYRDAEKRGMGGALWLIIVLLTGIIGLIIYLVVRGDKPVLGQQPGYYPYGQQPYQQQPYYQQPGQQQPFQPPPGQAAPAGRFCQKCGAAAAAGTAFCAQCGNRL